MLKKGTLLILDKNDIKQGVDAFSLSDTDLKTKSSQALFQADLVLVITASGENILLKNRYGLNGVVIPLHTYKEFLNWLDENNKPNITPKKKSFLGGIFKFNFWPFNCS